MDKIVQGVKHDKGKQRYDMLPFDAIEELVKVYTFGVDKYGERNWEKGIVFSRLIAAVFRHIMDWLLRETYDRETGLHHLAHAAWGCLAIVHFQKIGKKNLDDIQFDCILNSEDKEPENMMGKVTKDTIIIGR
jgi:hypothetical protein